MVFFIAGRMGALYPSQMGQYISTGASDPLGHYPGFEPFMYAGDLVIPIIDFHQTSYWEIDPTASGMFLLICFWASKAIGWLFTILAAVAFSGVLRKD